MDNYRGEKMKKIKFSNNLILIATFIFLFLITIFTHFIGSTDVGDYTDVAKFFSGEYNAKIRSSHSYFYGFMSSPFVKLTGNFFGMKVITLLWLFLLMLSIYYISGKDRKTLLLIVTAPIFWYMAPFINPIQISSLLFLWGYYFIKKYNDEGNLKFLFYSGLFVGLAWVFWDTILYFLVILAFSFLYDKKTSNFFYFLLFVFIGLMPRLILDQVLFNFAFFSILKSFSGGIVNSLWPGIIGSGHTPKTFVNIFSVAIILPLFSYVLFNSKNFKQNKKTNFFLIFSLFLILSNPQIRYTLVIIPIILLNLGKIISKKQLKVQIIFSIIISLLVVTPYIVQMKFSTNAEDFNSLIGNIRNIEISKENIGEIIVKDLNDIAKDFPNETFVVGNKPDDYALLARLYFGKSIVEFVSIQDYNLAIENKTILFEKKFMPVPNINERRQIWISGGIKRNENDSTNYENITLSISIGEPLELQNFSLLKKYNYLYVSKKS